MVQINFKIILLILVARCAAFEETTNDEHEHNSTIPENEHNITLQNVINIQFDPRKPIIINLMSAPCADGVVENKLSKLEGELIQRLDYIERKLESFADASCDKQIKEGALPTNITEQIAVANQSKQAEWDWSRCQEETVLDTRQIYDELLHPMSAAARLQLAIRGDGDMRIYLSREQQLDIAHGLYFYIAIGRTEAHLDIYEAVAWDTVQRVDVGAPLFSYSRWTRVALDVVDGSLEVRVGNSSTPLLTTRDPRLSQLRYIGFDTLLNSEGHAKYKYGC